MTELCVECNGTGYLIDQGYGYADIPEGWISVQACDECNSKLHPSIAPMDDLEAAREAARDNNTCWDFFEPPVDEDGDDYDELGDYAICLDPTSPFGPGRGVRADPASR